MASTTTYSVRTTRTVVHGPGGQYQVTENTSSAAGGWNATHDRIDAKQASALHSASGPRYRSGWGSRYSNNSESESGSSATMHGKSFDEVKANCLKEKKLYEDTDFPALDSSIFYSRSPPRPFVWKRPPVSHLMYQFHMHTVPVCITIVYADRLKLMLRYCKVTVHIMDYLYHKW